MTTLILSSGHVFSTGRTARREGGCSEQHECGGALGTPYGAGAPWRHQGLPNPSAASTDAREWKKS